MHGHVRSLIAMLAGRSMPVGFTNLITPSGRTREPHHRDDRGAGHEPRPTASKHVVETVSEFLVPVANQETERFWALGQSPCQLPGLLYHPRRARSGRAARDVHRRLSRSARG
jgi:hypothetical protein